MWEALGNALKLFFEKHFIPTVLSLVCGTIAFLCTPEDNWILVKISNLGYWIFASGCAFIIIQLIVWIYSKISSKKYWRSVENSNNQYRKKENEEAMRHLWDYVESLCPEEREYLKRFLKNKNAPITIRGNIWYNYRSLWSSEHIRKQEGYDDAGCYTQYVLEENFYQALCYSAEVYGKISRFDEV